MDIRLALMCGTDIPVPECQLTIHQPKIKEIALIGEEDFFTAIQCLTITKDMINQGESFLTDTNNFQIFMTIMTEKEAKEKRLATESLLSLLFPRYKVLFTPKSMIFRTEESMITIDENNFEFLQVAFRQIFCFNSEAMSSQTFNTQDAMAKSIAEKLMKGRQRVAAQKGETHSSLFSQYLSTITVGLASMSLQDCMDLTMYQLFDLVERYSLYINWDIDIRSRLAGATPDTKPDNWMKNIH